MRVFPILLLAVAVLVASVGAVSAQTCSAPLSVPATDGTFTGTTGGASSQTSPACGGSTAPDRVYQWTPSISGTATIATCGTGTNLDTVLIDDPRRARRARYEPARPHREQPRLGEARPEPSRLTT